MNKSSTERKDQSLYHVLAYLTIIRLNDLNMEDFKSLINVYRYLKQILLSH